MKEEELKKGDEVVVTSAYGRPLFKGIVIGLTTNNVVVEEKRRFRKREHLERREYVEKITS